MPVERSTELPVVSVLGLLADSPKTPNEVQMRLEDLSPNKHVLALTTELPACKRGGVAVVWVQLRRNEIPEMERDNAKNFAARVQVAGTPTPLEPVVGLETYPVSWQAWRIPVGSSATPRKLEALVSVLARPGADTVAKAYFIPSNP